MAPNNTITNIDVFQNYLRTPIRLSPSSGSTDVRAGDTSIFHLPANKVIDLSSLKVCYHGATDGTAAIMRGFPKFTPSMISQLEIVMNGITVQNIPRYNQIYNIVRDYSSDYDKYESKLFNNADPSTDTLIDEAGVITKYNTYTNTGQETVNQFKKNYVIDDWIGFLDFAENDRRSFFNTNMVGNIEIHITWAANNVLWKQAGAADGTYTISNLLCWVDGIEFNDDAWVNSMEQKVSGDGVDSMPFKHYKSYLGDTTVNNKITTLRVVENTSSLDKILFTYLHGTRNTQNVLQLGDPAVISGNSATAADLLIAQNAINVAGNIPQSQFHYQYLKSTKNPYLMNTSIHFKRNGLGLGYDATRQSSALIQFELDSQDISNPMNMMNAYQETLKSFKLDYNTFNKMNPSVTSFESWIRDTFLVSYSLEHLRKDADKFLVSGINTLASAVNIAVKITNQQQAADGEQAATPLLITEMTSVLRIGNSRTISIKP